MIVTAAQFFCAAVSYGTIQDDYGDYIVKLTSGVDPLQYGFGFDKLDLIAEDMYLCDSVTVTKLQQIGIAEEVAHDDIMTLQDDYYSSQLSLSGIGVESAWNHTDADGNYDCRGDGVVVAVIDSGVYTEHSDFNAANFIPVSEEFSGYTQWHGTFVAGIIAAKLNDLYADGIAPNVSIMSLCITDSGGNTSAAKVISAIEYAVDNGADVINISISGTEKNSLLEEVCNKAAERGVIIVSCVGNAQSSRDAGLYRYPAAFDSVISVSACVISESGIGFADYSCHNNCVDACAPGSNICSLYVDGATATKSGTSFSAPVVAAMAAIAKQQYPFIDYTVFRGLLEDSCTDMGEEGRDDYYGYGLVDIGAFTDLITAGMIYCEANGESLVTVSLRTDLVPDNIIENIVLVLYDNKDMVLDLSFGGTSVVICDEVSYSKVILLDKEWRPLYQFYYEAL